MSSQQPIERTVSLLLAANNLGLVSYERLQSLWASYGQICQLQVLPAGKHEPQSMILKYISAPATELSPNEGHVRKILSYQIEQYFYTCLAPQMPTSIAVASCIASIDDRSGSNTMAMIMTDLRQSFPVAGEKRVRLNETQTYAAIDWLANFHGFWWAKAKSFDRSKLCRPPLQHVDLTNSAATAGDGVWLNGGYAYLETRRAEYSGLCASDSEWSAALCSPLVHLQGQPTVAELVARYLAPQTADSDTDGSISEYETLIHGDVKSENLFATARGDQVALFDFQYVGLGLGVCDLAKLFTCSLPEQFLAANTLVRGSELEMGSGEQKLLKYYLERIRQVSGRSYEWNVFVKHWKAALVDWLRFQASWGFWGNTEWLEGRVRSTLKDHEWITALT